MNSKMRFKQGSIIEDVMAGSSNNKSQFHSNFAEVTVIQPEHPLCGQRCEVVQVNRAHSPGITIKAPDGMQITMPVGWTDYVDSPDSSLSSGASHLLDLEGLLNVVSIVARIKNGDLETTQ